MLFWLKAQFNPFVGKQLIYLPHAKPLTELVAKWTNEEKRKSFVEIRLLLKVNETEKEVDYVRCPSLPCVLRAGFELDLDFYSL